MVSIAAFQAVDPGSIPGRRNVFIGQTLLERPPKQLLVRPSYRPWPPAHCGSIYILTVFTKKIVHHRPGQVCIEEKVEGVGFEPTHTR